MDRIEIEHKEELFTAPPLVSELYSCSLNPSNYIPFLPFLGPRMPREIEAPAFWTPLMGILGRRIVTLGREAWLLTSSHTPRG